MIRDGLDVLFPSDYQPRAGARVEAHVPLNCMAGIHLLWDVLSLDYRPKQAVLSALQGRQARVKC